MNAYLAAQFGEENTDFRKNALTTKTILESKGFTVYAPWESIIPHAWEYPNNEWGLMVFDNDVAAIQKADFVIVLSYGRESTAGTNWEAGYAFGIGKKIIVVEMTNSIMSLMVANGRYATVSGLAGLTDYDFTSLLKTRTNTEQKWG